MYRNIQTEYERLDKNVYATLIIKNDQGTAPIECRMNSVLQEPYIAEYADKYEAAVVSFNLPIDLVPILIAQPGTTPGKLAYSFTFSYGGNTLQEYLTYDPQNNFSTSDPRYYYIYHYSHMIEMANAALASLFTAASGWLPLGCTAAPYITFNPNNGLFSLIAQTAYSGVGVYMNNLLYLLFAGMHAKDENISDGRGAKIRIYNNYQNNITIPTGAPGAGTAGYIMIQDYDSLQAWNTIKSVILTSNIGVKPEIQTDISAGGKYTSENIISEFTIDQLPARDRVIVYTPAKFRYHDIMGSALAKAMNFQFFMLDKSGAKYPIYINIGDMARVRLLFRLKDKTNFI